MSKLQVSYETVKSEPAVGEPLTFQRKVVTAAEPARAEKDQKASLKRLSKPRRTGAENIDESGGDAPQKGGKA